MNAFDPVRRIGEQIAEPMELHGTATGREAAGRVRELVAERLPAADELLGPAPQFRLRGRHRRRLMIKSSGRREAVGAVREAVSAAVAERAFRQASVSVDVDPQ
jgi:primosomal protein N' (replication factor Y)